MAIVKNDPFPGTDYTKYQEWEKVVLPSGEVLYTVPGNPAYVFDPVASNATGRKVFRRNPKEAIAEQQKQQELQDKQIKQQQFNQSPLGQLLPAGASIAGLYAANKLANGGLPSLGGLFGGESGGALATQTIPDVVASGGGASATGIGSGSLSVSGSVPSATPGLFSGVSAMPALPLAAIAAGTYLGGKSAYDMLRGKEDKSIPGLIGRGTLGIATGGLSELGRGLGLFGQKSTRERARENTDRLMSQAEGDQNAINYVQGMRQQYDAAPPDPSKPFYGGKYGSFDEYQKAGLNADDLAGVYGNLSTYGAKEWAGLTNDQRRAITQKNIDAGNYYSSKGEVEIKDKELAKKLKDEALGMGVPATVVDSAAKAATQQKWIRRNGQIVKVA